MVNFLSKCSYSLIIYIFHSVSMYSLPEYIVSLFTLPVRFMAEAFEKNSNVHTHTHCFFALDTLHHPPATVFPQALCVFPCCLLVPCSNSPALDFSTLGTHHFPETVLLLHEEPSPPPLSHLPSHWHWTLFPLAGSPFFACSLWCLSWFSPWLF